MSRAKTTNQATSLVTLKKKDTNCILRCFHRNVGLGLGPCSKEAAWFGWEKGEMWIYKGVLHIPQAWTQNFNLYSLEATDVVPVCALDTWNYEQAGG